MLAVLWLGTVWPATGKLSERTERATQLQPAVPAATAQLDRTIP
jgi:hypothetical protein